MLKKYGGGLIYTSYFLSLKGKPNKNDIVTLISGVNNNLFHLKAYQTTSIKWPTLTIDGYF